jgi:alkylation response protein AidB-like acyl-CoA dehydrogenase
VAANGDRPSGWVLNGRKSFASLSPTLDFMVVFAAVEGDGVTDPGTANFVVEPGDGVVIEETWDTMGLRATGSHDVIFQEVFVPGSHLIPPASAGRAEKGGVPRVNAWFPLTAAAPYVGIAGAALQAAADFAQERVPSGLGKPIAELEVIQRRLGQAGLLLHQARAHLYHTADLWDRHPERRRELGEWILTAKYTATNNAIAVVDLCMRVVGGASMSRTLPLERYYRDVRGGLSHPTQDDAALLILGQQVLAQGAWAGSIGASP